MKSFAAHKGLTTIDWKTVIGIYNHSDPIDTDRFNDHLSFMESWSTCCIGQIAAIIPRHTDSHAPKDSTLLTLGKCTYDLFKSKQFDNLLNIIELIEARARFLVSQERPKVADQIAELKAKISELESHLEF